MKVVYLDAQLRIHTKNIPESHSSTLIDIDTAWLSLGQLTLSNRDQVYDCFEAVQSEVPEESTFNFKHWYSAYHQSTLCVWYAMPKSLLEHLPQDTVAAQAQTILFGMPKLWPNVLNKKPLACLVNTGVVKHLAGYVQGHCVCYKQIHDGENIDLRYQWQYLKQEHPQWQFENRVYISEKHARHDDFDVFIQVDEAANMLDARAALYGFN